MALLEPGALSLSSKLGHLVNPSVVGSTGAAYANLAPMQGRAVGDWMASENSFALWKEDLGQSAILVSHSIL